MKGIYTPVKLWEGTTDDLSDEEQAVLNEGAGKCRKRLSEGCA